MEQPLQELNKPVALGRTAEIYAWQDEFILKLFYDWVDLEDVEYEARIARAIYSSGLPVPKPGDIIHLNGRHGIVYQRVYGRTMWDDLLHKPWKVSIYAKKMAKLQALMHENKLQADIPGQRQKLTAKINRAKALTASLRAKALAALQGMPDGDRLCHGDFHPENILMTLHGEVIIDWVDATIGNPLADVARTTILIRGAFETDEIKSFFQQIFTRIFLSVYIGHYFKIHPEGKEEYRRWLPIVAAARVSENIAEEEKWLIAQAEKGLA